MSTAADIVAKARGGIAAKPAWEPPAIQRGASPWRKVCVYGPIGTGKTMTLAELLLAGERIFALVTDEGLVTIENHLRRVGRLELIDNLLYVVAREYKAVNQILAKLDDYYGDALRDLKPTVKVWDGFSVFQTIGVDTEVMPDKLKAKKITDAQGNETDDSLDPFAYWDKIKRGTGRIHDKFLGATYHGNPGWHTLLTCHEDEDKDRTGKPLGKFHPEIKGGGRKSVLAEYDLVVRTKKDESQVLIDGKLEKRYSYSYQLEGANNVEVKNRGWDLPPEMPADFGRVWRTVTNREGK